MPADSSSIIGASAMPWTVAANTVTVNTVINVDAANRPTTILLLDTLRDATGRADLEFAAPPTPLSGGFYAEMLRFRLADAPADLDRDLVARIVPNPAAGVWEAMIQRAVADQGFPTPTVRLTADETGPLGRYVIVMDAVDGQPPMAGLGFSTIATQIPNLVRHLPDQLARIAADLHNLDAEPLVAQLDALDTPFPTTTAGFIEEQAGYAQALDRPDIAAAAARLVATEPRSRCQSITHGDLHPFNLLVTPDGTSLIDWTVARVAHPGFTLGFTDLMLANPPIPLPRAGAALLRPVGRNIAKRFLSTYRTLTDGTSAAVDDESIEWHRKVHSLRIVVELAGWDASGTRPTRGHPWLILEPVARRELGLGP
jgi:aminoglycoside phosphotransferase (APT) family kinase protein